MNKFFGPFVVKNIDKLVPQLERLLVRSEANIEVWEDFFVTISDWKSIDKQALGILTKIKNKFLNFPEPSIKIVNSLTSSLIEEGSLKEVITFISNLISGEHNAKRKIVYIRMLQGVMSSLKNLSD